MSHKLPVISGEDLIKYFSKQGFETKPPATRVKSVGFMKPDSHHMKRSAWTVIGLLQDVRGEFS
jgi:hypothetical protein